MTTKLNLGCQEDYREGYVNIDINTDFKADIHLDFIKHNLPYDDETVDEILAVCILEHIPNPLKFLQEMKRVLKPNGKIIIITDNAGFIWYHIGKKVGRHDNYKSKLDSHYFFFQKGHLQNFADYLGLKTVEIDYIRMCNEGKGRLLENVTSMLLTKQFGFGRLYWEVRK